MTKYYKGQLFNIEDVLEGRCIFYICHNKIVYFNDNFNLDLKTITEDKIDNLISFVNKDNQLLNKNEIFTILDSMFKNIPYGFSNNTQDDIIYELIEDEKGNLYGKEIISGSVFPLVTKEKRQYHIEESGAWNYLYDRWDDSDYLYETSADSGNYLRIRDKKSDDRYYEVVERIIYHSYRSYYQVIDNLGFSYGEYQKEKGYRLAISFKYQFHHDNLLRGEVFIQNKGYANMQEIEKYQEHYRDRKALFRKVRNYFIQKVREEEKLNVFKESIIPKKEEEKRHEREKMDDTEKLMEEIELLLIKLKNYNYELYSEYIKEYQKVLTDDEKELKNIPLNKMYLESFKARILLSFCFNHNDGMSIIEYLSNLKRKYLCNIFDDGKEKTNITINDLDKLTELFLKTKDDYSISLRRNIIRNIALIYLLELYENKNMLDNIDLDNSYVNDYLVSILLWLNTLKELDLIESEILINLDSNAKLEDVIYLIKNITFKKFSKEKVLSLHL